MLKEDVQKLIADRVQAVGSPLPIAFFDRMCYIESRYNPNAVSSTNCKGLFQFSSGTWALFGVGDRLNPTANIDAAIKLANANYKDLKRILKRDPKPGEVYMAHNLGVGGASRLIAAEPHVRVTKALIGSKPQYNPLYLMSGKLTAFAGEAVARYLKDFAGV